MSWYNSYRGTPYKSMFQSKIQTQSQSQTVDQNYANGILFMAMSTLQTLESKAINSSRIPTRDRKEFGNYDRHDFSYKETSELKGQLRNNIMLLANSKMAFELTYGKGSYKLPQNYNKGKVVQRLKEFHHSFQKLHDVDLQRLIQDITAILQQDKYYGLFYEQFSINDPYQNTQTKNSFIKNCISASQDMRNQEEYVKEKYKNNMDPTKLEFNQNKNFQDKKNNQNNPQNIQEIQNRNKNHQPQFNQSQSQNGQYLNGNQKHSSEYTQSQNGQYLNGNQNHHPQFNQSQSQSQNGQYLNGNQKPLSEYTQSQKGLNLNETEKHPQSINSKESGRSQQKNINDQKPNKESEMVDQTSEETKLQNKSHLYPTRSNRQQ